MTGETFTVAGTSDDGQWLQLAENGTPIGWAAAEFLTVEERSRRRPQPTMAVAAPQPTGAGRPAQPGSFAPATMSSPDFGAQAFLWWRPEIRRPRPDACCKNGGFNWVKQTFAWETIEARPQRAV